VTPVGIEPATFWFVTQHLKPQWQYTTFILRNNQNSSVSAALCLQVVSVVRL